MNRFKSLGQQVGQEGQALQDVQGGRECQGLQGVLAVQGGREGRE